MNFVCARHVKNVVFVHLRCARSASSLSVLARLLNITISPTTTTTTTISRAWQTWPRKRHLPQKSRTRAQNSQQSSDGRGRILWWWFGGKMIAHHAQQNAMVFKRRTNGWRVSVNINIIYIIWQMSFGCWKFVPKKTEKHGYKLFLIYE